MGKWDMVRLGDVVDIINGFAFKSEKYSNSGIRIIRITNVQKGYVEDLQPQFYPIDEASKKYHLLENDLLISLTGNVGRVAIISKEYLPAALNQRVACLRIKNLSNIDRMYIFSMLNSKVFENDCITSSKGVAQKNLSTEWLKQYLIPLPPLDEQKRIAKNLDLASEIVKGYKEQLAELDKLVQSVFYEMFGDPVTNEKGWISQSLLDFGSCKNGMNFGANENGIEIKYLGVGDFKELSMINGVDSLSTISLMQAPSKEYLLKDEDIIFVRSNGNKNLVGRCVVVYPGDAALTFSGFCIRFRKSSDNLMTIYLLYVLKCASVRRQLLGRGANIQNLNQQILKQLAIPIPPISLQSQFVKIIADIENQKSQVQLALIEAENLFNGLMQKYFE